MLLSFDCNSCIYRVEGVLLKITGIYKLTLLINNIVFKCSSFLTYNLHHLSYFTATSDKGIRIINIFLVDYTLVCAPRIQWIDGWILSSVRSFTRKTVECTYNFKSSLCYRFFKVSSGRGNSSTDCYRTIRTVTKSYFTSSFIEFCNS